MHGAEAVTINQIVVAVICQRQAICASAVSLVNEHVCARCNNARACIRLQWLDKL